MTHANKLAANVPHGSARYQSSSEPELSFTENAYRRSAPKGESNAARHTTSRNSTTAVINAEETIANAIRHIAVDTHCLMGHCGSCKSLGMSNVTTSQATTYAAGGTRTVNIKDVIPRPTAPRMYKRLLWKIADANVVSEAQNPVASPMRRHGGICALVVSSTPRSTEPKMLGASDSGTAPLVLPPPSAPNRWDTAMRSSTPAGAVAATSSAARARACADSFNMAQPPCQLATKACYAEMGQSHTRCSVNIPTPWMTRWKTPTSQRARRCAVGPSALSDCPPRR